ncbi:MAG: aminomethyl-transferring glycine dehydrogenase subunit GcvPB, partial [Clostridia bacterium]
MSEAVLLSFEKSMPGRHSAVLAPLDVPKTVLPAQFVRKTPPMLPELCEVDVCRHYTQLQNRTYGVNDGFYPLGSCTMKYNPALNEAVAALSGFTDTHPLAPESATEGCRSVLRELEHDLCEVTG